MNIRTDLISEQQSFYNGDIDTTEEKFGCAVLNTVKIKNDMQSKKLQKPIGTYCTVSFPKLYTVCNTLDVINATLKALKTVADYNIKNILVIGLGNVDITPDALGPLTVDRILATRHLSHQLKKNLGLQKLNSVCSINPSVLGKTGIESYDIITATAGVVKPDIIIVIDALACRSPERLCSTIQLSNSGICPGSGVNNSRKELSFKTMGIPVVAIGVPTVIDANSFFESFSKENMMVTPKEIDMLIEKSADVLSRAINIFLQPALDISTIESLT